MNNTVLFGIGGIPFEIDCNDLEALEKISTKFENFISDKKPSFSLTISVNDNINEPSTKAITIKNNKIIVSTEGICGEFDLLEKKGFAQIWRTGCESNLENFIRIVFAYCCLDYNGFIIHSSGVIKDDKGYLFFGPSGAGKSTVAKFAIDKGLETLNDDLVMIKKEVDGYYIYSTPFWGEYKQETRNKKQETAKLLALFKLIKSEKDSIEPLPYIYSFAEIISSIPFIATNSDTKDSLNKLIKIVEQMLKTIPCYNLYFSLNNDFWNLVR